MHPKISEDLLAKHFAKETTDHEDKEIQLWLRENPRNRQLYEELFLIWATPTAFHETSFDKERVYQKINSAILDEKRNKRQLNKRKYLKFTASILLFLGLASTWLLIFNIEPEILSKNTEYGQKMKISLPDGSIVHLNSGSLLEYPKTFSAESRIVQLKGEAFFEIKKNPKKPFIVQTELLQTKVLGTSFNIKSYEANMSSITVNTGSVQVNSLNDSLILKPNQQAFLENEQLKVKNVNASQEILWKEGVLQFQDTPMLTVKTQLEKWYGVEILFEDESMEKCVFTGQFKNEKLLFVLEVLKETFGISYEGKSKQITIKGKGC